MTNAELAILTLISEKSRHGYEIEQTIEGRGMRDWTEIGFSSIYYILKKLEKESYIESHLEQPEGQGPARKVYSITKEGRRAQVEGALGAIGSPKHGSIPFLLGLSCYPSLPSELVLLALNGYRGKLESRLIQINQKVEEQSPLPPFVEAMFDYSKSMLEAERNWMQEFIKEVEVGNV